MQCGKDLEGRVFCVTSYRGFIYKAKAVVKPYLGSHRCLTDLLRYALCKHRHTWPSTGLYYRWQEEDEPVVECPKARITLERRRKFVRLVNSGAEVIIMIGKNMLVAGLVMSPGLRLKLTLSIVCFIIVG